MEIKNKKNKGVIATWKKGKEFGQGELPARYMAKYCLDGVMKSLKWGIQRSWWKIREDRRRIEFFQKINLGGGYCHSMQYALNPYNYFQSYFFLIFLQLIYSFFLTQVFVLVAIWTKIEVVTSYLLCIISKFHLVFYLTKNTVK